MFNSEEKNLAENQNTTEKLQWLIIGRLMSVFLLLIGTWIWNSNIHGFSFENFPRGLLIVFLIAVGLSIVYFFALRFIENKIWQVRLQFFVDIFLTTWLVWTTGDVASPYISLYTVLIFVASIFLTANETLFIAIISSLVFTIVSFSTIYGYLPHFSESEVLIQNARAFQILGFHNAAFLFVGLLAGRLAQRNSKSDVQLLATTKDLAKLRVLHERIIESIRSGLVTTDLDGTVYIFNAAAEEITGLTEEEVRGKSIYSLLGNIEQPIAVSLEAAENGEQIPRYEIDFSTPDGFTARLGYGISPLFSENGETTGLIITFQDLTDIRTMEESVRRKDRLAAVGRVAAGLAHEIRNPLGAMRGAIQVLQPSFPKESPQASLMDIVTRESDRLNKIITNFLDYARPQNADFAKTDVCELINDSVTLLRHSPDIKENHIIEPSVPDESLYALADATQLKQVFWNLSRNAIQSMPKGGTLKIVLNKLANRRLQIIFQDDGVGMSASQVEQLFEPFSGSTTGGTGLGLSIVYQIVRDHNGTINIKSKENSGTTITLEFPSENALN